MKKFQYLVVKMGDISREKGEEFQKLSYREQEQAVLNELGGSGWELVYVYDRDTVYYMKREIT